MTSDNRKGVFGPPLRNRKKNRRNTGFGLPPKNSENLPKNKKIRPNPILGQFSDHFPFFH